MTPLLKLCSIPAMLFVAMQIAVAQQPEFLERVPTADLTPDQNRALSAIRTVSSQDPLVVRINPQILRSRNSLALPLNTGRSASIETNSPPQARSGNEFVWSGRSGDMPDGTTLMAVNGNSITATIQTTDGLYRIRPIGGGLHAYFKVDQARIPPEHPPIYNERSRQQRDLPPLAPRSESDRSIVTISVLVAYTPAVQRKIVDVKGLVDLAFIESNQSYENSDVRLRLVPAQANPVLVTYNEAGSHDADLDAFLGRSDGKMDDIHNIRAQTKANIAVLLTDDASYCGLAAQILATKDTAFAVVYHECATGYYSFAHEIGHLQGARHNPEADNSTTPFPYGHGFMDPARSRRTIMSYNCGGGCPRLPQWARPPDWGTDHTSNDARVLNETANYIAGF